MYAGHLAAGLALKGRFPQAPTGILLVGGVALDLLFGPLLLLGVERASITAGVAPGFTLDHIDWSHSLLMALVWSAAYGALFARRGRVVAAAAGCAVFSHFVLDAVMHPPDLALWPGSAVHLGLGLWRSMPTGWWFVELGFVAGCLHYYRVRAGEGREFGGRPMAVGITVVACHVLNSPWLAVTS